MVRRGADRDDVYRRGMDGSEMEAKGRRPQSIIIQNTSNANAPQQYHWLFLPATS